ncbi:MAG: IS4 family transposase [Bacteroidota bacterium]
MNKSNHFSGQPTFCQIINLIPKDIIAKSVVEFSADRYYKKFNTYHHLLTMLFACFGNCNSLREIVTGMAAMEGKLATSGIRHLPARSTFADANSKRNSEVFESIYLALREHFQRIFPDSPYSEELLYVIDSSVITLFQEVFKGSGSSHADGRRKGGLKVHMAVPLYEQSPCVAYIGDGADNDLAFHKHLTLPAGSTVIFDRGYRSYPQFNLWSYMNIRWITRLNERSYFRLLQKLPVDKKQSKAGIIKDMIVELGFPQAKTEKVTARIINYIDPFTNKALKFLTNDLNSKANIICELYAKRWSIELLFKRLKQNMPLQYFLGDNRNAIRIQIWCALICDLLLNVIRKQLKRKWAFSSIVSIVRLHLFNYLNLFSFLENPDKCRILSDPEDINQLKLNWTG